MKATKTHSSHSLPLWGSRGLQKAKTVLGNIILLLAVVMTTLSLTSALCVKDNGNPNNNGNRTADKQPYYKGTITITVKGVTPFGESIDEKATFAELKFEGYSHPDLGGTFGCTGGSVEAHVNNVDSDGNIICKYDGTFRLQDVPSCYSGSILIDKSKRAYHLLSQVLILPFDMKWYIGFTKKEGGEGELPGNNHLPSVLRGKSTGTHSHHQVPMTITWELTLHFL